MATIYLSNLTLYEQTTPKVRLQTGTDNNHTWRWRGMKPAPLLLITCITRVLDKGGAGRRGEPNYRTILVVPPRCAAAVASCQLRVNTNILPKEGIKYVCTKINWGSEPCKQLIYYNEKQTLCLCSSGKTGIASKQAARWDIRPKTDNDRQQSEEGGGKREDRKRDLCDKIKLTVQ